jgi:hypothetical protein
VNVAPELSYRERCDALRVLVDEAARARLDVFRVRRAVVIALRVPMKPEKLYAVCAESGFARSAVKSTLRELRCTTDSKGRLRLRKAVDDDERAEHKRELRRASNRRYAAKARERKAASS